VNEQRCELNEWIYGREDGQMDGWIIEWMDE